jgi:hypothetical protein
LRHTISLAQKLFDSRTESILEGSIFEGKVFWRENILEEKVFGGKLSLVKRHKRHHHSLSKNNGTFQKGG